MKQKVCKRRVSALVMTLAALTLLTASCTHVYHLQSNYPAYAKELLSPEPDVAKVHLKPHQIFLPAKRGDGKSVNVRWSKLRNIERTKAGNYRAVATNVATPLTATGLGIIAAGLVTMVGFGVDGELKASDTGIGKYAGDGWLYGGAIFSLNLFKNLMNDLII